MAYTTDLEDVVLEIIDILGDNFAAKLNAIETAKADDITLEDIQRIYFGDKNNIPPNQNMPAILVKGRTATPEATATNNRFRDVMDIEIECYIHADPNLTITKDNRDYEFDEYLDMKIMRYARAIVEILRENEGLNGKATIEDFSNVMLSNIIPYDDTMVKACRIELEVRGVLNTLG